MIQIQEGVFHLTTDHYSYLFTINPWGLPEQLHFGRPVELTDAASFALQPGLGWGTGVLLEQGKPASCPENMALLWSGSGRGDYRESPVELEGQAAAFRYESHRSLPGIRPTRDLPQAHGKAETLELVLTQENARLTLYFTLFPTALTRRTVLENTGSSPLTVTKLMSSCLDLPGSYDLTAFHGGWISEMQKRTAPVTETRQVIESTTGFSSHKHHPGFLLSAPGATEEQGLVYGFNLVYSGNHYAGIQRSAQNLTRVVQGISPDHFRMELAPGEALETPEAVLTVSDGGFEGVSQNMHAFVNGHIVPPYWQNRSRPVLYNSWEGCMFRFDEGKLLALARKAKKLGCELFVLDDGWFGKRNADNCSLGDYDVNKKKLPRGLKGLGQALNQMGLQFGLWLEPESVSPDSALFRAHPDWALTQNGEALESRNQLLLDLTRPQVQDYIVQQVSAVLDSAPIQYVKWDMNRHSVALGAQAHRYILGLYQVMGRIFGPRPEILLETCASGGNRFDLGMLCYGPQIWCSDNTDPVERRRIQENLSYLYPQSTFGTHVSAAPHAQTLRTTPLSTRGNVSLFGCLGYELNLNHLLPVEEAAIQAQVALYKKHRRLLQFGTFRRLPQGWQISGEKTVIAALFYELQPAAPGYEWLRLRGLHPRRHYRLQANPQKLRLASFGALVKHVSPVDLDPNGVVLRTADRRIGLQDSAFSCTASGAALMAGIPLPPRFRGTGYDLQQRTQADFGSDLYILTKED